MKLKTLKAIVLKAYSNKSSLPHKSWACVCKQCITDPCLSSFSFIGVTHSSFLQNHPIYIFLNLKTGFLFPFLPSGGLSSFVTFISGLCQSLCGRDTYLGRKYPLAEQGKNTRRLFFKHASSPIAKTRFAIHLHCYISSLAKILFSELLVIFAQSESIHSWCFSQSLNIMCQTDCLQLGPMNF